jgi:hypothetical protein
MDNNDPKALHNCRAPNAVTRQHLMHTPSYLGQLGCTAPAALMYKFELLGQGESATGCQVVPNSLWKMAPLVHTETPSAGLHSLCLNCWPSNHAVATCATLAIPGVPAQLLHPHKPPLNNLACCVDHSDKLDSLEQCHSHCRCALRMRLSSAEAILFMR